ncbi:taste receptor type 1 member 3 [Gouania willdenowi]|uniref:taste receptor type 1 member 3 n=1 Tax=Gouania willdenowi TaxID=441366 RepID=UPI0010543D6F|nr:taste receptor type 1 member 3 [Gouania willdenowi]
MSPGVVVLVMCSMFSPCCTLDLPEWFQNISTSLFYLSGDVMLGGLFPINQLTSNLSERTDPDNISCERLDDFGLGLALVMKYAVDEINAKQFPLPGIKLGYEIYDTCKQSAVIVKPTLSFLTEKSNKVLSVECNYTDYETSVSAMIGPYTSEMVSVIGKLMGFFLMPQISYGATSDKFSDNHLYPSFFRTVPSDKWQVDAMGRLMQEFSWNWVAVVGSEEEYGQQGIQQFTKIAEKMSVCVAYQGLIPVYSDAEPAVQTIVQHIIAAKVGVVIVFSLPEPAWIFFKEVIRRNFTAVWVGSTSWSISNRVVSLPNIESIGTILGFTDKTDPPSLFSAYAETLLNKLSEEQANMSPPTLKPGNPDNPCSQCWNLSPANMSLVESPAVQKSAFSVYAAIYSAAHALHNLLRCNSTMCLWGNQTKVYPWKLLEALRNVSVNINGTLINFDENGNPNIGYNVVEWVWEPTLSFRLVGSFYLHKLSLNKEDFEWHTDGSQVPLSMCSAECKPGQVRRVKGFHSCCFDCLDCRPGTYQAKHEDVQCTPCPDRQWSLPKSTNCTDPIFDFLAWDSPMALIMMIVALLVVLTHVSVGGLFLKHRGTPLVMASGGVMSFVALLGLVGSCFSLLLFLGEPGDTVCRLQLPLITIFQTAAFSIILAISLQIFLVTEFPETTARHLHLRGPASLVFVLVSCAIQGGLSGWFVQEAPTLSDFKAAMKIDFVQRFLACPVNPLHGFALMQGFNAAMALLSFMSTFMAVKPIHQYNLARDITFSTLIYCVIWVSFIPVYIGTENKQKSIVHVYFTMAGIVGLMAAYYFPKCYFLLRRSENNKREHFCTFLEGVPPRPAEEQPQPDPQSGQ